MTTSTWIDIEPKSDFSIYNLPYGVFLYKDIPTPGVAIGDYIINLRLCSELGIFDHIAMDQSVFYSDVLNDFIATGKQTWSAVRKTLIEELTNSQSILAQNKNAILVDRLTSKMLVPVQIGDYTDFIVVLNTPPM